jgi:hypothetical protein
MPIQKDPMSDLPEWPPTTLRDALTAAREALTGNRDASFPEGEVRVARRALDHAVNLLDRADREMGVFLDAEPYRLVLDPVPAGETARESEADGGATLLA